MKKYILIPFLMVAMTGSSSNKLQPVSQKSYKPVADYIKIDSATATINKIIELDLPKKP